MLATLLGPGELWEALRGESSGQAQRRAGAVMSRRSGKILMPREPAHFSIRKRSKRLRRLKIEPSDVGASLKAADFLGFRKAYQIAQVNSLGENGSAERGLPAGRALYGQKPHGENRRKPAPHGVAGIRGEDDSKGNWRRKCDWGRTVSMY